MINLQGSKLNRQQSSAKPSSSLPQFTPSATVLVKSPPDLRPANGASAKMKLEQIDEDTTAEGPVFPLTKFPTELQLRVLWHCVVSSLPILNAGVPTDKQIVLVDDETPGQSRINASILRTCKAYYDEGIKLLYSYNQFSYTCEKPLELWRGGNEMGKNLWRIEELILRPLCRTDSEFPHRAAVVPMYWLRQCKNVKMLRLDFCGVTVGYEDDWEEDDDSMSLLLETVENLIVERKHSNIASNGMSELVITGLPENDLGLFALRSMALLVQPNGKIGIGTGQEGRRYIIAPSDHSLDKERLQTSVVDQVPKLKQVEPQMHWLRVEDVPGLIANAASDPNSDWLRSDV
ncbi:MAG: hypothetical protein LQ350_004635 [Teloschistes chrysophthalmus]|nr:MAG: hypothetical protein LQ350_004635 [Niorma chrysophthalma]